MLCFGDLEGNIIVLSQEIDIDGLLEGDCVHGVQVANFRDVEEFVFALDSLMDIEPVYAFSTNSDIQEWICVFNELNDTDELVKMMIDAMPARAEELLRLNQGLSPLLDSHQSDFFNYYLFVWWRDSNDALSNLILDEEKYLSFIADTYIDDYGAVGLAANLIKVAVFDNEYSELFLADEGYDVPSLIESYEYDIPFESIFA